MSDILTERSGSILRIQLNRPDARKALTAFLEKRKPDFTKSREPATAT